MGNEQAKQRSNSSDQRLTREQVNFLMQQQRLEFEAKTAEANRRAAAAVRVAREAKESAAQVAAETRASAAEIRNRETAREVRALASLVEQGVLPSTSAPSTVARSPGVSSPATNYQPPSEPASNPGLTPKQVSDLLQQQRLEFEKKLAEPTASAGTNRKATSEVAARGNPSGAGVRNIHVASEANTQATARRTFVEHEVLPSTAVLSAMTRIMRETSPNTASTSSYQPNLSPSRQIYPTLATAPPAPCPPFQMPVASPKSGPGYNRDLNCPTCGCLFTLKLYNCGQGHAMCEPCKLRGARCAKRGCGRPVTEQRNRSVEEYIAQQAVPCLHYDHGCTLTIKLIDLEIHLRECPFREYSCPLPSTFGYCSWRGRLEHMASHFDKAHPSHRMADVDKEMFIDTRNNVVKQFFLIIIGNFHFLAFVKIDQGKMYMAVQLMGTAKSAAKWSYEMHIYNKVTSECQRKFFYSDVCSSNIIPIKALTMESHCMVLPSEYALTYANTNRITYKIYIKKDTDRNGNDCGNHRGRGRGRGRGHGRGRPRNN